MSHGHWNHLLFECTELKVSDEELSDSVGESDSEGEEQEDMVQLMQEMDQQLEGTAVGETFKEEDGEHQDESKPVEVDFNVVHSLLESYGAQMGGAGPTSNILHSLGITIPRDDHNWTWLSLFNLTKWSILQSFSSEHKY